MWRPRWGVSVFGGIMGIYDGSLRGLGIDRRTPEGREVWPVVPQRHLSIALDVRSMTGY